MRRGSHFGPRLLALLLLCPGIAAAQQPYPNTPQGYPDGQPPPPPPPGYGQPVPPPPPGYGYQPVAPPPPVVYVVPPPPPPERFIKLRLGADGALAAFVPGVSYGANFSARGGIQIGRHIGIYGDLGGGFGLGGGIDINAGGGGVTLNFASYWRLGAMGELDFGPFFIALGPALFSGTWGGLSEIATSSGAQQAAFVADGYFPALLGRIGFQIGRSRNKFTIAFENMLVFGTMTEVSNNAKANGSVDQSVAIGAKTVGYAPALMFGWDMR